MSEAAIDFSQVVRECLVGRPPDEVAPWPSPWDVDDLEYHGDRRCESSSTINAFIKSPRDYYNDRILGEKPAFRHSPSMSVGTALHHKILVPSLFYGTVKTLPGKAACQASREAVEADPHACWLEPGDIERVFRMESCLRAARERSSGELRGLYDQLLQGTDASNEMAFRMVDVPSGIGLKVKFDCLAGATMIDLKTSRAPDPVGFMRSFRQYGYHRQAALYHHVLVARGLRQHERVIYIAVCNGDRPECYAYEVPDEVLAMGWHQIRIALTNIRRLVDLGSEEAWLSEPPLAGDSAFKCAFEAVCHKWGEANGSNILA